MENTKITCDDPIPILVQMIVQLRTQLGKLTFAQFEKSILDNHCRFDEEFLALEHAIKSLRAVIDSRRLLKTNLASRRREPAESEQ